jgi:tripartite-type tricarboxylate transporter receptor subunit TctC
MHRRPLIRALVALALGLAVAGGNARAADKFPDHPITLIVPFAPGGNLDIVARTLAGPMSTILGQTVIVENRAGAGGSIAGNYVAHAKPDGYTLMVSTPNAIVVLPLITKTSFDLGSFAPIGQATKTPLTIVVKGDGKYADAKALLAAAKANPGKITIGHSGIATTNHVAILQMQKATGLAFAPVAYRGSGPALTDLMGGQVDAVVDQLTSSANFIKAGSLRAVATLAKDRDPQLPNVPTLREEGVKDFDASTQAGLLAPANTPTDVVEALNAAMKKALSDPEVKSKLDAIGSPAAPSTPQDWAALLRREQASAQGLAKEGVLKAE